MRFTAEDAFDASDCGEPIIISRKDAIRIVTQHGVTWEEFEAEHKGTGAGHETFDAADVLRWLGY